MPPAATSPRPRLWLLFAACLAASLLLLPATARAQDADPPEAKEDDAKKPEHTKSHSLREIFLHILYSVGWTFGIILLLVSIALVTLVALLVMELRMGVAIPPVFVEEFTDTVNKRRFKEAYEMAKEDPSYVARVLSAGMSRLQYGIEDAREASYSMLESVKAGKEQLIVYLATIGTLGPLLGLVGTVFGMILSFMTLSSGDSIKAQQLAGDISHALVVTLLGIALSVPAIFAHAFFKNRLTRITHDTGTVADDLLTQMYYNSKKAGASAAELNSPPPPPSPDRQMPPVPAVCPK
ncbi:MAG: MotA/TolQ/ExbB proton channel family protein [Gemmataceae bacterium]|nr:MotA/TolQ/ExbB proton channel family protein [Gemmataceae bacterium]